MKLDQIDWAVITPAQAGKLLGAARNRENAALDRFRKSDTDEDLDAAMAAYQTYENLQVLHLTGERPA